ncbi:aspartate carbamoyltransferase [Dehalococcoidia bacterium]|nr:aspartate carbamoyltransferase [Dehalococcoidia bacterium]MCL0087571.1 aspartate carbamoyltransferase [Dehalococcoidia bacterium]
MTLAGRDLISINDFSNEEIEAVLNLADEMSSALEKGKRLDLCQGKELYTIFYEPSTRTRSSFETAMHRLGGTVVSHAEAQVTSAVAKGESIADTVRVLERYADVIVMRHPLDGSTRLAAEHSSVPVISGGDGAHEHPTQTLLDLYTIRKEKGAIRGKSVALCGDLRHGRTVHSLVIALARFGAEITCIAPPDFELPDHIRDTLKSYRCKLTEYESLEDIVTEGSLVLHQAKTSSRRGGARLTGPCGQEGFMTFLLKNLDVLYFTRLQRERLSAGEIGDAAEESYRINRQLLEKSRDDALIMHPMPRTGELAYEVDQDKRAAYFRQAGYGVPVRMALIALLLGAVETGVSEGPKRKTPKLAKDVGGVRCLNGRCVTNAERYATAKFCQVNPQLLRCYYCDWMVQVA